MKSLALVLLLPGLLLADSAIVTWEPPTERVDGTPLSVDEIGAYILRVDGVVVTDTIPGTDTTYTVTGLTPGTYSFDMATQDTVGRTGPFSAAVSKSVEDIPSAPGMSIIIVP